MWAPQPGPGAPEELHAKATDLKAQAIAGEISLDQLRLGALEIIKVERPKAPAAYGSTHDTSSEVIEAAFCRSAGLPGLEKQYKPEVLEAADKFQGFGIQELLLQGAAQGGYSGRPTITRGNLKEILQAAFSTHTVTTMLTQLGHKAALSGFYAVPQAWREVVSIQSVSDFKEMTSFRLTADLEYEELGPAGEIKHGTLGQESYTNQAKTYAKMMAMTRTDLINDDLGVFNDIRNRLGIGGAIKLNKEFWTVWLAAANAGTFWTSGRGNYISGGTTTLTETGLNEALVKFRTLGGLDGNMMSLTPSKLLVPPELEATAKVLYISTERRDTTSSTKYPTANIHFDSFKPVVAPELSNSAYTGYSTTQWFLLPDPAIIASASICFLNGVEAPTIESADADFNTLGVQFRGYHDFGISMSEWRASVHSAGA